MVELSAAVEGMMDEAALRRVAAVAQREIGPVYGLQGKPKLLANLLGYNNSARFRPWIVLVDMDRDHDCAKDYLDQILTPRSVGMSLRIVVRSLESWLLADAERVARFLSISQTRIPADPDSLENPKTTMVNLARGSRKRDIVSALVPKEGSGKRIGVLYVHRLISFINDEEHGWRPQVAAERSDSLARCLNAVRAVPDIV